MKDVTVTTTVSAQEAFQPYDQPLFDIPSTAQTVIEIARAVRFSTSNSDEFDAVFKGAIQAVFGTVNW